jgi:cupin fold WbuC family metalloprotein
MGDDSHLRVAIVNSMVDLNPMTTKIYSKLDPSKLLHMIVREVPEGRTDLCPNEQYLQCAALRLPKGTTFRPHRHITKPATEIMPEESWHIINGWAVIHMYDTDGTFIDSQILIPGHTSFTFNGAGHNYEVISDGFICLEYKVGPYLGVEKDKIFI